MRAIARIASLKPKALSIHPTVSSESKSVQDEFVEERALSLVKDDDVGGRGGTFASENIFTNTRIHKSTLLGVAIMYTTRVIHGLGDVVGTR